MTTKNLVSQPPLTAPVIDTATGKMSRPWAIFIRDLYRRVAFKGGNSIDDILGDLEALTLLVEKNIEDIATNVENIATNAEGIALNAEDIEALALRVTQNEEDILNLQERVVALEYRVFDIVNVTANITLEEFKIAICKNVAPIDVTLKLSPVIGDEIQVKRSGAEVTVIGLIDGVNDLIINVPNYSLYLVFNGTDWSVI